MGLLKIFLGAAVLYALYLTLRLYQNYMRAKGSGFKLRIFPVEIGTPLFTVLSSPFRTLVLRLFPENLARTFDLGVYGIEWRDRVAKRERETPGYLVVSPSNTLELFVEDGEIANAILARR